MNLHRMEGPAALETSRAIGAFGTAPSLGPGAQASQTPPAAATVSLSAQARAASPPMVQWDTNLGATGLNPNRYFSGTAGADGEPPPVLMPTTRNIRNLQTQISATMPAFLASAGIPTPPASISYDGNGQLQLPADYPYASQFKQGLANDTVMERELRTVCALSSNLTEMNKSLPFQQAYLQARSPSECAAVVARFSALLSGAQPASTIALLFDGKGQLSLTADGKPVV